MNTAGNEADGDGIGPAAFGVAGTNTSSPERIRLLIASWVQEHNHPLKISESGHGYPVADLRSETPKVAMAFLRSLDAGFHPVYHGMHNNEYRRKAGLPDVTMWKNLDPSQSHQSPDRRMVYATTSLLGGLVHTTLEHKMADANPHSGETYSLRPMTGEDGTNSFIEVSPHLDTALRAGEERFTDGLLYILPSNQFIPNPQSNHEVTANQKVTPLIVAMVGKELGRGIVMPESARWIRQS